MSMMMLRHGSSLAQTSVHTGGFPLPEKIFASSRNIGFIQRESRVKLKPDPGRFFGNINKLEPAKGKCGCAEGLSRALAREERTCHMCLAWHNSAWSGYFGVFQAVAQEQQKT